MVKVQRLFYSCSRCGPTLCKQDLRMSNDRKRIGCILNPHRREKGREENPAINDADKSKGDLGVAALVSQNQLAGPHHLFCPVEQSRCEGTHAISKQGGISGLSPQKAPISGLMMHLTLIFFFYLSVSLVFETGSHVAQVRLEFAVAGLELLNLLNLCFE